MNRAAQVNGKNSSDYVVIKADPRSLNNACRWLIPVRQDFSRFFGQDFSDTHE
jgi:hypothetical protein